MEQQKLYSKNWFIPIQQLPWRNQNLNRRITEYSNTTLNLNPSYLGKPNKIKFFLSGQALTTPLPSLSNHGSGTENAVAVASLGCNGGGAAVGGGGGTAWRRWRRPEQLGRRTQLLQQVRNARESVMDREKKLITNNFIEKEKW